jgi:hypothetical protein
LESKHFPTHAKSVSQNSALTSMTVVWTLIEEQPQLKTAGASVHVKLKSMQHRKKPMAGLHKQYKKQ